MDKGEGAEKSAPFSLLAIDDKPIILYNMTMTTKYANKPGWSWWEFEDEKPDRSLGLCDWCGAYVGQRKGSKMFIDTTVSYSGVKQSGRVCDIKCKELFEKDAINNLKKLDNQFPKKR